MGGWKNRRHCKRAGERCSLEDTRKQGQEETKGKASGPRHLSACPGKTERLQLHPWERQADRPASGGPGGPRLVIGSLPAHLSPHMFGGTAPSLSGPRGWHVGRGCAYFSPSPFRLQPERRGFAARPGRVTPLGGGRKGSGRARLLTPAAPLPRDPSVWFLNPPAPSPLRGSLLQKAPVCSRR